MVDEKDDQRTEAQKKKDKEDWRWRRFVSMPGDFTEVDPDTGEELGPLHEREKRKQAAAEKKKTDENDDNY